MAKMSSMKSMVGVTGFEPATYTSRTCIIIISSKTTGYETPEAHKWLFY
jgi:hypothetical protein